MIMRSISQWWQGTKAFALIKAWELSGRDVMVSPEIAANRARSCADFEGKPCSENVMPTKLSWHVKWANGKMREKIEGATTPLDEKIGVCKACSCELRAIVHFDADVLRAVTPAASMAKLPAHCWKRKELA